MGKYASNVVEQAKAWIGKKESDGSHKEIIDVYNSHNPRARGYKVKYTDSWCATFVSAVAIKLGYTDIIPTECSCQKMITLFKNRGSWIENENRRPNPGEILFYDWDDNGSGDNKGNSDHVGIVEKVSGNTITVIEGNYKNAVKRRRMAVNGRYIRGYGVPKYDAEPVGNPNYKESVAAWQKAATADGFKTPRGFTNGVWDDECRAIAKFATVKRRLIYKYPNLTKIAQKAVGTTVDGKCGKNTTAAIKAYQERNGLKPTGEVNMATWMHILGV